MILFVASFIISVEAAAITLVCIYIAAMITNRVVVGFSQRKAVFIISYKPYKICDLILYQFGRGATILNGEGAYTHQHKQVILVVVSLMQVAKLKEAVTKRTTPRRSSWLPMWLKLLAAVFPLNLQQPRNKPLSVFGLRLK